MRLGARKARHLNVSEVSLGVISSPSLDVVASVGAAIQKRRHDLALFFFLAGKSERRYRPAKGLPCARTGR